MLISVGSCVGLLALCQVENHGSVAKHCTARSHSEEKLAEDFKGFHCRVQVYLIGVRQTYTQAESNSAMSLPMKLLTRQ